MGIGLGCYYADWDEETDFWCVFHTDLGEGKAFASYFTETEAQDDADKRNIDEGYDWMHSLKNKA